MTLAKTKDELKEALKPVDYEKWKSVMDENFPTFRRIVEAMLSVVVQLWFDDIKLPFALVIIGAPAGYKTATLGMLDESYLPKIVYYTDHFTPKSFVSHKSDKRRKELEQIDLLPRIKGKVLITPELAPIFGQNDEKLLESLSILTRVLDGKGYTSDSGSHGRRGYRQPIKFMWLAASTPLPYRVWNVMGNLGTKIYFIQMPKLRRKVEDLARVILHSGSEYQEKLEKCMRITADFIDFLKSQTPIKWNPKKEPAECINMIANLALLLSRLRGAVNVHTREEVREDGTKQIVNYTTPVIEVPDRAAIMLYNFARGHAFIQGRKQISEADIPLLIEIVLSSAPQDRVEAFRALLRNGGEMTTTELMRAIGCSRHTAIRAMNTLSILKLVVKEETTINYATGFKIRVHPDLQWCMESKHMKAWGVKKRKANTQSSRSISLEIFDDPMQSARHKEREGNSE